MELILLVNLAFSVVGFFFIFRMWREVKTRRDEYGENFGIPKGREKPMQDDMQAYMAQSYPNMGGMVQQAAPALNGMSMEQLTALVSQVVKNEEKEQEPQQQNGDLQALLKAVAAQNGGA